MNFQADTLIALAFLAPVAAFAVAEIVAGLTRRLEPSFRVEAPLPPATIAPVDVRRPAANDEFVREAA